MVTKTQKEGAAVMELVARLRRVEANVMAAHCDLAGEAADEIARLWKIVILQRARLDMPPYKGCSRRP